MPEASYSYPMAVQDVPLAAFDTPGDLEAWVAEYRTALKAASWLPSACNLAGPPISAGETRVTSCSFPSGPTLSAVVSAPPEIDPCKPVVVIFAAWGGAEDPTPGKFTDEGHVTVFMKVQDWYPALAPLYNSYGYLPVWGAIAYRVMNAIDAILPNHDGEVVVSTATGSLVVPFYLLWRDRPRAIVTNGILLSLDWLRRNYRISGFPNIWDHGMAISYTPIFLTMAPAPIQFQIGSSDAFYPYCHSLPAASTYTGSPRGQTTDEVLGHYLVLSKAWEMLEGCTEMFRGTQGHLVVDFEAAKSFVARNIS